jgi:beta-N-acetylhexosaminidase
MPEIVTTYADIYTNAFLQQDIQCAYKHFPGHGSSTADSHLGFVDVTHTWQKDELTPYRQLFAKPIHCGMVMSAHIVNRQLDPSGLPATLSHRMLTGILRHELKFNGVIITDDMQMNAIAKRYSLETAVTKAINAGADMLLFGNQLQKEKVTASQLIALIEKQVRDGAISEARINEAYERVRYLKGSLY